VIVQFGLVLVSAIVLGSPAGAPVVTVASSVRTSSSSLALVAPAVDPSTIADTSSSPNCTITFDTSGLITDEEPGQEYPRGTINLTISDGTTNVNATMTFDKSNTARIEISGISGAFLLNLDTFAVTGSF
jgi:hypothetical protein